MGLLKKKCYGGKMAKGGMPFPKRADNKERKDEMGVHKARLAPLEPGESDAGYSVRAGDMKNAKKDHEVALGKLKSMPNPKLLAEGGMLTDDGYQSECDAHCVQPCMIHEQASGFVDETAPNRMPNHQGLTDMGEQDDSHERQMVRDAIVRRKQMLSQGGKVANSDEPTSDFMPNEFDDLNLRDGLEFSYTGANSGDEDGNPDPDKEMNDMIAKAMMKRRKQTNPRPA
jgi:hypothetical protein